MSIRVQSRGRANLFLCDVEGCKAARACNANLPQGWVEGFGRYHLCTLHKYLKDRYDSIVYRLGICALTGYKGPG